MILKNVFWKTAEVAVVFLIGAGIVYGHVTIQPKQSAPGKNEKYTMKVPTEKFVPTVRIDVEFPTALVVLTVEPKPGWAIEEKRDASGKLVGAIFTGGSIPTGESSEFYFTGRNPDGQGSLSWKVIQIYQDGSKSEWTGAAGSRTPAPLVELVVQSSK